MSEEATPDPAELARRLAALEAELAKVRAERDEFKKSTYSLLHQIVPYKPITPEELHDMLHGPRCPETITGIIAELEREIEGRPT